MAGYVAAWAAPLASDVARNARPRCFLMEFLPAIFSPLDFKRH
jgi:hypothetical protein